LRLLSEKLVSKTCSFKCNLYRYAEAEATAAAGELEKVRAHNEKCVVGLCTLNQVDP
jgi:hypothetical protein